MYRMNYSYDNNNTYPYLNQLPSGSNFPGAPTMPTSPVNPIYPVKSNSFNGNTSAATASTPLPPVLVNPGYTQAYLKTQIGKKGRFEFLIGTNTLVDRTGTLEDVGISYIVLRDPDTNDKVMADLYSIKFVTFYT